MSLRRFIAQEVDRVDDIITYETDITPLSEAEYFPMIDKWVKYFRINSHVELPVDQDALLYLYHITKGRLRFIFGLLNRLFNTLQVGTLTDRITLSLEKPVVMHYDADRINRFHLSAAEVLVLKTIVSQAPIQVKELAEIVGKKPSHVSTLLSQLLDYKLVGYTRQWRNRYYYASIDAQIAYSK